MKRQTVPISERALIQRINRALKKDGEILKKARSTTTSSAVGDFFIVDTNLTGIVHRDIDLEDLGRKLKVLQVFEHLEE